MLLRKESMKGIENISNDFLLLLFQSSDKDRIQRQCSEETSNRRSDIMRNNSREDSRQNNVVSTPTREEVQL